MFSVCLRLFVCLSVRKISKNLWTDCDEIFGGAECMPCDRQLDFGGAQDHDPDTGNFNEIFAISGFGHYCKKFAINS